jgi:hypothetical protein
LTTKKKQKRKIKKHSLSDVGRAGGGFFLMYKSRSDHSSLGWAQAGLVQVTPFVLGSAAGCCGVCFIYMKLAFFVFYFSLTCLIIIRLYKLKNVITFKEFYKLR